MFIESFRVESPHVRYGPSEIESEYRYDTTELVHEAKDGASRWVVRPKSVKYNFRTTTAVPKLGYVAVPNLTLPDASNPLDFEFDGVLRFPFSFSFPKFLVHFRVPNPAARGHGKMPNGFLVDFSVGFTGVCEPRRFSSLLFNDAASFSSELKGLST